MGFILGQSRYFPGRNSGSGRSSRPRAARTRTRCPIPPPPPPSKRPTAGPAVRKIGCPPNGWSRGRERTALRDRRFPGRSGRPRAPRKARPRSRRIRCLARSAPRQARSRTTSQALPKTGSPTRATGTRPPQRRRQIFVRIHCLAKVFQFVNHAPKHPPPHPPWLAFSTGFEGFINLALKILVSLKILALPLVFSSMARVAVDKIQTAEEADIKAGTIE